MFVQADYGDEMRAITAATRPCQADPGAVSGATSTPRDRARCQSRLIRAGAGHPGGTDALVPLPDPPHVTQQLIIDAGCDPVPLGGLDTARAPEDLTWLLLAAMKGGALIIYRFAIHAER